MKKQFLDNLILTLNVTSLFCKLLSNTIKGDVPAGRLEKPPPVWFSSSCSVS